MNEEQAALEFFARPENLPLTLAVAEQADKLREQMNNRLWRELQQRIDTLIKAHELAWRIEVTEDKNTPDSVAGLHCSLAAEQSLYLRPMVEQQYLGGDWRIYFGLMWSAIPSAVQLRLPAVIDLKESLQQAGFKNNENFLGWQWTTFHPRRKDFLLRYANHPEQILDEMEAGLKTLLIKRRVEIERANAAIKNSPRGLTTSLNQLRDELTD